MIKHILLILMILTAGINAQEKKILYLSWSDVFTTSLDENLTLKSKALDYEAQDLEVLRSWSNFLPTLTYQGLAVNNLELPVLVFMGQRFQLGSKYNFQHALDLTLPIFTGGSRYFDLNTQQALRRSLSEELKGKEEEIIFQALQAYYLIILSDALKESAQEAVDVAKLNLDQVTLFYNEGTATQLDLQRASAQYYSTIPQMEAAVSGKILAHQRLKALLNLPLEDSIVVTDSLIVVDFLDQYKNLSLAELKNISIENKSDLKAVEYQLEAAEEGENIALSQFAPVITASAGLQHQAFKDNANISWSDYSRAKSLTLSVYWPLFEGGRRIIDYQLAGIRKDQIELLKEQVLTSVVLEVEQSFYSFREREKILVSHEEAMLQSSENLRLSNLLYSEGMSTQLDVLNAQLLYNNSRSEYLKGLYSYNVSQLSLLRSIGMLKTIWNQG